MHFRAIVSIDFSGPVRCTDPNEFMEEAMNNGSKNAPEPAPVLGLHHNAYRCRDAEETRHFYEDVLGLPLVHVVKESKVPSTGENTPFVHLFFELKDKSCIAFFDLGDNVKPAPSPNTPAWVTHFAMKVPSVRDVEAMKSRLEANGISVVGVTDHGFVKSIYFFDPNGIRLELTAETATQDELDQYARTAHAALATWTKEKAAARA
jgi:catechol 2,3-dioxygenase-like lactoylglutathione lyase family enzyme